MNESVYMYIDESYTSDFCGVCIVCVQGDVNLQLTRELYRKMSIDPGVITHRTNNSRYHFADDSISMRQSIVPWISKMPISAYLSISQIDIPEKTNDKYDYMYHSLLPHILKPLQMKYSKRIGVEVNVLIQFENLSNKKSQDNSYFEKVLSDSSLKFEVVTKESEPLIFLPDYFLGFVQENLKTEKNNTWQKTSLKLLSEKIGVISVCRKERIIRHERGEEVFNFLS